MDHRGRLIIFFSGFVTAGLGVFAIMLILVGQVRGDLQVAEGETARLEGQVADLQADLIATVSVDPVAAYCHGMHDGAVRFGLENGPAFNHAGIPFTPPTPEEIAVLDGQCYEYLTDGGELFPGMRGPLLPDEAD